MRVRIVKQPRGVVQGIALNHYKLGCVYDMPTDLALYLIAEGFADAEMRSQDQQPPGGDRRDPGRTKT